MKSTARLIRRRPSVVLLGELGGDRLDETKDRRADRLEVREIAADRQPGGEPARAAGVGGVEHLIDQGAGGADVRLQVGDGVGERLGEVADHEGHQRRLQAGRRSEVMQQIDVGDADLRRHRLQGHRRRPAGEQQFARRLQRLAPGGLGVAPPARRSP